MAKLIWLGEPDGDDDGPRKNVWNGITFKRGEAVEVTNEHMIAKARKNPFYSVDGKRYDPKENGRVADGEGDERQPGPVVRDKTQLSEMNVAELRALADERGIDHAGLNKSELREKLAEAPAEA